MFLKKFFLVFIAAAGTGFLGCAVREKPGHEELKTGIEVLAEDPQIIVGKKVGIITNHTGLDRGLNHTVDVIMSIEGVEVAALFAPEHGFRGGRDGHIDDTLDKRTGLKVFSLHGGTRSPSGEMLEGLDMLIFDIQDIGSRSYTYISTMKNCMEQAALNDIDFIVLDRPNPLGGVLVDGPILDMEYSSFIGAGPIAYVHGMTVGELALFFNEEMGINCRLEVVPMKGWSRGMRWRDTGLLWTPPSPHIPEQDTPLFYAVTGILGELPLVNIGVGYTLPFKLVGAPWMDGEKMAYVLNGKKLPGVLFQPFHFTPFYRHYKAELCSGFRIIVEEEDVFMPVETGYNIIGTLLEHYPDEFDLGTLSAYHEGMFNRANGTGTVLEMFRDKASAEQVIESYRDGLERFREKRNRYLIYKR